MRDLIKPQLDLFYQWPNHKLGRELKKISEILDRHPEFAEYVYNDLSSGKSTTGNLGMSADQVLRAGIIKNILKLTYEKLSFNTSDSMATRSFLLMSLGEKFSSSCLQDNISKISEETWEIISKTLVLDAKIQGFEGCKIARVDSTVTDTNIAYPTDSKLLYDCIRVTDREFKSARKLVNKKSWRLTSKEQVKAAKSLRHKINNSKNSEQRLPHYKELLRIAKSIKKQLPGMILKIEKVTAKKQI